MEKYDILLNEIIHYLSKYEVNKECTNTEVISLYDLYKAIYEELAGLRNITINSKISKKLNKFVVYKLILEKELYTLVDGDENKSSISFFERNCADYDSEDTYLIVYKDKNANAIYFSDEVNHHNKKYYNLVKKNYDLILNTLNIVENYIELLGSLSYKQLTIKDDLFKINLSINKNGDVKVCIDIKEDHDLYDEYSKKWYQRELLCDIVNDNIEDILKRVTVSPQDLDEPFKKIYFKHIQKNKEPNKEKILRISK